MGNSELLYPGQMRVSRIQLCNWGVYGAEVVSFDVPRTGLLITGKSGVGKSTLLDALNYVLKPKNAKHNRAAGEDDSARNLRTYITGKAPDKEPLRPVDTTSVVGGCLVTFSNAKNNLVHALIVAHVFDKTMNELLYIFDDTYQNISLRSDILEPIRAAGKLVTNFTLPGKRMGTKDEYMTRLADRVNLQSAQKLFDLSALQDVSAISDVPTWLKEHALEHPENTEQHEQAITSLHSTLEQVRGVRAQLDFMQAVTPLLDKLADYEQRVEEHAKRRESFDTESDKVLPYLLHQHSELLKKQRQTLVSRGAAYTAAVQRVDDLTTQIVELNAKLGTGALENKISAARSSLQEARRREDAAFSRTGLPQTARSSRETLLEAVNEVLDSTTLRELDSKVNTVLTTETTASDTVKSLTENLRQLKQSGYSAPRDLAHLRAHLCKQLRCPETDLPIASELVSIRTEFNKHQGDLEAVLAKQVSVIYAPAYTRNQIDSVLRDYPTPVTIKYYDESWEVSSDIPSRDIVTSLEFKTENNATAANALRSDLLKLRLSFNDEQGLTLKEGGVTSSIKQSRKFRSVPQSEWVLTKDPAEQIARVNAELTKAQATHAEAKKTSAQATSERERYRGMQSMFDELQDEQSTSWSHQARLATYEKELADARDANKPVKEKVNLLEAEKRKAQAVVNAGSGSEGLKVVENALAQASSVEPDFWVDYTEGKLGQARPALPDTSSVERIHQEAVEITRLVRDYLSADPSLSPYNRESWSKFINTPEFDKQLRMRADAAGITLNVNTPVDGLRSLRLVMNAESEESTAAARMPALLDAIAKSAKAANASTQIASKSFESQVAQLNKILSSVVYNHANETQEQNTYIRVHIDVTKDAKSLTKEMSSMVSELSKAADSVALVTGELQSKHLRSAEESASALLDYMRLDSTRRTLTDPRSMVTLGLGEHTEDGEQVRVISTTRGMSGGERERLSAFCLAAAVFSVSATEASSDIPQFGPVILDEAFTKSDSKYAATGVEVLRKFSLQPIILAPESTAKSLSRSGVFANAATVSRVEGKDSPSIVVVPRERA